MNVPVGTRFFVEGNAICKEKDSTLFILAIDTSDFQLLSLDGEVAVKVNSNPHFNNNWRKIPPGTIPTPMSAEQFDVFQNYFKYHLIGKSVLPLLNNDSLNLVNLIEGRVVLLNFWYYGCIPCMAEIPALNMLDSIYRGDKNFKIYSLFRDSVKSKAGKLYFESTAKSSVNYENYLPVDIDLEIIPNSANVAKTLSIFGYPTNLLIDEKGIVRKIYAGASVNTEENIKSIQQIQFDIKKLLAEKKG
ncbi:TlpA disulfide reductase family protein [Luteibaculum oceani]|uniref:TlpA disulfide reductase family protein n=1 Tax=Luteibaculum oceani TaxID=1294296 RepID=UPI0014772893|nr:TlpA disulfide reductase family protein [Luteibaculum oceani]